MCTQTVLGVVRHDVSVDQAELVQSTLAIATPVKRSQRLDGLEPHRLRSAGAATNVVAGAAA